MNIEKRNLKIFDVVAIIILAAILLTAAGGMMIQRGAHPLKGDVMSLSRGDNPMMQAGSAQTGPTGSLVMSTGIVLLLAGFGALVVMVWARRNYLHQNKPSLPPK